jgi:hypothetical protein
VTVVDSRDAAFSMWLRILPIVTLAMPALAIIDAAGAAKIMPTEIQNGEGCRSLSLLPLPSCSLENKHRVGVWCREQFGDHNERAAALSGTRCDSQFFVPLAGSIHDPVSKSRSCHRIAATSPPRCTVRRPRNHKEDADSSDPVCFACFSISWLLSVFSAVTR